MCAERAGHIINMAATAHTIVAIRLFIILVSFVFAKIMKVG